MSEIVFTAARFGFLLLLWVFVFTVVGVIRRDLGVRASRLVAAPRGVALTATPAKVKRGKAASHLVVTLMDCIQSSEWHIPGKRERLPEVLGSLPMRCLCSNG